MRKACSSHLKLRTEVWGIFARLQEQLCRCRCGNTPGPAGEPKDATDQGRISVHNHGARHWGERSAAPKPFAGAIGRNTRTPSVTCSRRCRRDRLRARRPRLQTETFRCTLEAHGRRESFSSNNTPRVIRGGWRCRGYGSSGWAGCRPNCLSFSRSVKRERPSQRAALAWLP